MFSVYTYTFRMYSYPYYTLARLCPRFGDISHWTMCILAHKHTHTHPFAYPDINIGAYRDGLDTSKRDDDDVDDGRRISCRGKNARRTAAKSQCVCWAMIKTVQFRNIGDAKCFNEFRSHTIHTIHVHLICLSGDFARIRNGIHCVAVRASMRRFPVVSCVRMQMTTDYIIHAHTQRSG